MPKILKIFKANMDWQFVTRDGVIEYIAKYVSKCEPTKLSEMMSEALEDIKRGEIPFNRILYKLTKSYTV